MVERARGRGRRSRGRREGFTLLELLLAMVIFSVAILGLSASMSTGVSSVGDSINQRAAREIARSKLEEAIANQQTAGGGPIDDRPGFQWTLTSEERTTGASDSPTEKYVVLTCTVTFPQDNPTSNAYGVTGAAGIPPGAQPVAVGPATGFTGGAGSPGAGGQLTLVTIVDPPDLQKSGQQGATGQPGAPTTGH